mmetsp:Transcript_12326/g.32246  ORF Transcript_12326/g.32246 Transcript_12326/m.32246 type:complete len:152 (-) Transcript_12326:280-735(-)|eukprot:CAMPEP_0119406400 /NCGR_PEP_ID=MMETSP1335-20130426/735_1 /TAXON_ID=259385 /ORGANISM="Chrysoculter rhomboideus, Strain RCC1486" /LENGTH=151 /DNA_ID=CAMNT_0007430477 /DNA_START=57 /DNA_END=512 /DNA_ORIENTATION=+
MASTIRSSIESLGEAISEAAHPKQYPINRDIAQSEHGLDVRTSLLPGVGQGLFAVRKFKKGDPIGSFAGKVLKEEKVKRLSQEEREFVLTGFVNNMSVDASRDSNMLTRYIRESAEQNLNAEFVRMPKEYVAVVVATRDIEAGEEIYAKHS